MSLTDLVHRVLTQYRSDTRAHLEQLSRLAGPQPGDIVMGTAWDGEDFIGRVVTIGGNGLTNILRDDGRWIFHGSKCPLVIVQRYNGPPEYVYDDDYGGKSLKFAALEGTEE